MDSHHPQLAPHHIELGPNDLELLQIDADILASGHHFDPPPETHDAGPLHQSGELQHSQDGLPIQLDTTYDLQHRLQLDLLLQLDLGGHVRRLQAGGGDFLLGGDEAHLPALFHDEAHTQQAYESTLCKYVLGQHEQTACYGKPFQTRQVRHSPSLSRSATQRASSLAAQRNRAHQHPSSLTPLHMSAPRIVSVLQEAVDFVCANMTVLNGLDPESVNLMVGPVTVLAPDWNAAMDREVAKGTGYMEITVSLNSSSSRVQPTSNGDGSTSRKKSQYQMLSRRYLSAVTDA